MYLFFSSDIYSLYKKDVLAAISLPKNYCVHFRYPKDLVPENILNDISLLVEKEGIIVYVSGNDNNVTIDKRKISFFPIRTVRVKKSYFDNSTSLLHVFLELNHFIETNNIPDQSLNNEDKYLPPHKFIIEVTAISWLLIDWHQKVKQLVTFDNYFIDHLFFSVNIRYGEIHYRSQVEIVFDKSENSSYCNLQEDKNYLLDLAIYNSSTNIALFEDYYLKLDYSPDNFFITNPENIQIGADADNRIYKIITRDVNTTKISSYLKFQSFKKAKITYEELLRLNIKRNGNKVFTYIFFAATGILGTAVLAFASVKIGSTDFSAGFGLFALGLILMITTYLGQYYYFNKRS